jgi:hypothetical protein
LLAAETVELGHPPLVSTTFEDRTEPRVDAVFGDLRADEALTDADHVGVVVLARESGARDIQTVAARIPSILLAAMAIPMPLPHTQRPRSAPPSRIDRPTAAPKSG